MLNNLIRIDDEYAVKRAIQQAMTSDQTTSTDWIFVAMALNELNMAAELDAVTGQITLTEVTDE